MIVLKKNGTTLSLNTKSIYRITSKIEFIQRLLSEDVINITVEAKHPIPFNLGDKIEHNNRFYHLNFAPKVKREQGIYTYDLTFEGSQYLLRQKVYFNLDKENFQTTADFSLTGEIEIFLRVLITNINSLNQENWILGDFPQDTETKTLSFNGENCLAVLQKICQEYDTEFEIIQNQNNYTLNIKKIGKTLPYAFQYGKGNGLYSLTRENINNDVVTRLYAFGSTENIPSDYRNYSDRLRMPDEDYIQDDAKVALFGLKEGIKNFDDIKPTFKGIISEVKPFNTQTKTQDIVVSNMDFDLNERDSNGTKWLINDTPAKLHFNKGNLAGYSFELSKNNGYNHATKTFKIKQWTDERGQAFPDPNTNAFIFNVGDEFTLLDIVMPPEYINNAENKLLEEAQKEYEKQSKNNAKYSLEIDPLFLAQSNTNTPFEIGDYLRVIDTDLNIDKTSRIIGISQDLNEPFKYQLDIADDYEINFTLSVLNDIKDTKTIIKTQEQVNRQQHLNSVRNLAELRESVFDTEGYFDPQNIKPQSIETNMLSIGAKNQQFALENITLNPNVSGNPMYLSITGGKLVHFSLEANIREWNIAALNLNNLANTTYYVYAKVLRGGNTGTWLVTTEKIRFDERSDYYHFLCYLLYTPKDGKREAEAMYGSVTMHGGQINAGRIKSNNGKTYFDLDTGEISGKITFTNDSPALQQVSDSIQVGGRNLILNSQKYNRTGWGSFNGGTRTPAGNLGITITKQAHIIISNAIVAGVTSENFVVGERYVVSFEYFGSTRFEVNIGAKISAIVIPNTAARGKFEMPFVHDATLNGYFYITNVNDGTNVTVRNLKIEKGNKATDWTPAPEDVEAQITTAQNTANQALGLTQAQSANITALQQKTNFLSSTAISGNAVATGTLIVGNGLGANAGITGLGGDNDIFLWGGETYENRGNAEVWFKRNGHFRLKTTTGLEFNSETGYIGGRYSNGVLGFKISMENGYPEFAFYKEDGTKVYSLGQNGIYYVQNIPESYTLYRLLNLNSNAGTDDVSIFEGTIANNISMNNNNYQLNGNMDSYLYQAGQNQYSDGNRQYEGYKSNQNKHNNVADGWYARAGMAMEMASPENGSERILLITVMRISSGKVAQEGQVQINTENYVFN